MGMVPKYNTKHLESMERDSPTKGGGNYKARITAKYDKLRSGKGKQQQHDEAMSGVYAPKKRTTSDGYMHRKQLPTPGHYEHFNTDKNGKKVGKSKFTGENA